MTDANSAPITGPTTAPNTVPMTAVIFTLNEAVNLPHCLASLKRFDEVVIVDSYSTDETQAIAAVCGASFYQNPFTGFGDQRNWALDNLSFKNDWLLILDADECVTP
ncbi:MAG: glycosyltransferase involved in cell wall biosynthesis, partial [Candidatus Azotimanducaceae bacterium]